MRIGPAIAALRDDRSLQLRAQAAMFAVRDAWRGLPRVAPVLADLAAFGNGAALPDCVALAELFADGEAANRFVDGFCSAFAAAAGGEPFGQLPFRHGFDGVVATLLLARSGSARLTLQAQEPGAFEAATASFSDALRWDAVVAGEGTARFTARLSDGTFAHQRGRLSNGSRTSLDLCRESCFVERVERRLVSLRLQRAAPAPGPVREYTLVDGRMAQQSAGDIRESRYEMMVALLGRMKRREAAPLIAAIAVEGGPDTLRWQALREGLALDTARGFAALCQVARAPLDSLAVPAGALRAQLIETYPELGAFEAAQCQG